MQTALAPHGDRTIALLTWLARPPGTGRLEAGDAHGRHRRGLAHLRSVSWWNTQPDKTSANPNRRPTPDG